MAYKLPTEAKPQWRICYKTVIVVQASIPTLRRPEWRIMSSRPVWDT